MNAKQTIAALIFTAALSVHCLACAQGSFLCMLNEETTAITNDENGNLKYTELRDSKGALVAPQISTDGNTYLPFRYICDITGIADGNNSQGELGDNSYRFVDDGDSDRIEIKCNTTYYCHNIGESFDYIAADGSTRNVAIYNIRGTLYAPMGYLAVLTGSQAIWNEEFAQIMFLGNGVERWEYLNENNGLRRDKQMRLGYEVFGNNLVNSPLYLKTDGMTIANLSEELPGNPAVRSISRSGADIYYIDENDTLSVMDESTGETRSFMTNCATAFVLKNKIYGIKNDSAGETSGYLFSCNTDGSDLRYLTQNKVFNLIMRNIQSDYYLFYCDAQTRADLHMIRLSTVDDYEIQITDFEHNNLLSDIKQFAVGVKNVYYLDSSGAMHVIEPDYPLEQASIARLRSGNVIHTHATDGSALNNITSMNYDHINDLLYIMADHSRVYCYVPQSDGFAYVCTMPDTAGGLALFHDSAYMNYIASTQPGGIYSAMAHYNNGVVTAGGSE